MAEKGEGGTVEKMAERENQGSGKKAALAVLAVLLLAVILLVVRNLLAAPQSVPEPPLGSVDPVLAAAQAELEEAGGYAFEATLEVNGQLEEKYSGEVQMSSCTSTSQRETRALEQGAAPRILQGASRDRLSAVNAGSGWEEAPGLYGTPAFLELYAPGMLCTLLEQLGQVATYEERAEAADLPGVTEGGTLYSGEPDAEKIQAVRKNNAWHILKTYNDTIPNEQEMENASGDYATKIEREDTLTVEVGEDGAPRQVWLKGTGEEKVLVHLILLPGKQDVTYPENVKEVQLQD